MNITSYPSRSFEVGIKTKKIIKDCAKIYLEPNEQVTFTTSEGSEYDVVRKSWGYYATPSLNHRLLKFDLRGALIKTSDNKYHIVLVESKKQAEFIQYLIADDHLLVRWLDSPWAVE